MIMHVATFTWYAETTTADQRAVTDALDALVPAIPELVRYWHGRDLGIRAGTADYAVVAVVAEESDLPRYLDHPEHRRIVRELIAPASSAIQVIQMAIGDVATARPPSGGSWRAARLQALDAEQGENVNFP
jgi:hypothetical protein